MRRLPSLSGVEAFVAVARTGSVKSAADELSLSSPALSRRIQSLERFIGRALFTRGHQSMRLNADGERMMVLVGPALDQLSDAIESLASTQNDLMRLRLGVSPLYAAQKLIPRLPDLKAAYPAMHLDFDTAPHAASRLGDGIDAAITVTRDPDPALYARRLDHNKVFAIAARHYRSGPGAITRPEQLKDLTVLIHRDMPETFEEWRRAIGMEWLEPAATDHYDSGQLMLDAAAQGVGVAFMHEAHLSDSHDDRLVQLFDIEVVSPYSYWFVCRPRALESRPVKLFHDWLVAGIPA